MQLRSKLHDSIEKVKKDWGVVVAFALAAGGGGYWLGTYYDHVAVTRLDQDLALATQAGAVCNRVSDSLRRRLDGASVLQADSVSRAVCAADAGLIRVLDSVRRSERLVRIERDSLARATQFLRRQVESDARIRAISARIADLEKQRVDLADHEARLQDVRGNVELNAASSQQQCRNFRDQQARADLLVGACANATRDSSRLIGIGDDLNVVRERLRGIQQELNKLQSALVEPR